MVQNTFHLSVRYKDFEYSATGDREFIGEQEKIIQSYLHEMMNPEEFIDINTKGSELLMSNSTVINVQDEYPQFTKTKIQKFIESLPINSEWQYTLAMGYYITHVEGNKTFTAKLLRKRFRDSRHTVPNNIHFSVNNCVKKGYFQEDTTSLDSSNQRNFSLTDEGNSYIRSLENDEVMIHIDKEKALPSIELSYFNLDENPDPRLLERVEDQALSILYIFSKEFNEPHLTAKQVYNILCEYFTTEHTEKVIQLALSRSRPLVRKVKDQGHMCYYLTKSGIAHIETILGDQLSS
ncbi:hypothetical protein [Jeotgalibacillus haloalkalitolerans]|uniref:Transcriptional regulator n=1 Tax=Jeotgalibacillus haloalkalitolerans TaxID=3104292 RepID=A0ABU5KJE4_9BACL|nr:hypothetical protein [Jeotgalibacillus sp. HH7-29]MDZ5711366.1 hypothetical protein [Jeotgalibacillus sp. HH7-29]